MTATFPNLQITGLLSVGPNGDLLATNKGELIGHDANKSVVIPAPTLDNQLFISDSSTASGERWATGTGALVGLGNVSNTLNNTTAILDPLPINDNTQGYSIGSRWINTLLGRTFTATSVATGAAVWVREDNVGGLGFTAGTGLTLDGTVLNANGSATILALADSLAVNSSAVAGQVPISTGIVGTSATFGALSLSNANSVSGTLPVANGGTGTTTFTANKAVIVNGAGTALTSSVLTFPTTIGTNGQPLVADGAGNIVFSNATLPLSGTTTTLTLATGTVLTIPTTTNTAYNIQLDVVGRDTTTQVYGSFTIFTSAINTAGTVTLADTFTIFNPLSTALTVTLVVSGTNILVNVAGITTNVSINWRAEAEIVSV